MKKIFQRLFLFETFEIKTKLSKRKVLERIEKFTASHHSDYYGKVTENGFCVSSRRRKVFWGGSIHNSFAPLAKATVTEKDGITVVSGVLRMNWLVYAVFIPLYFVSLIYILPFLFVIVLMHFAFFVPAEILREELEYLL